MSHISELFVRKFTKQLEKNPGKTVYDLFNWKTVDVYMEDYKTHRVIINMKGCEFPEDYTQNACNIIASKYFRKAGVNNGLGYEYSMKEIAHRLVNFWVSSLCDENIIKSESDKKIVYDELVFTFLSQMWAPNSPQWFNTGLKLAYGISGSPDDLFYYDSNKEAVVKSKDRYTRTQASACFILSIEDKLLGAHSISEQYVTETKLFKGGSGTGSNFSNVRAVNEKLSGGGVSSGLLSFLKGLDRNAGAIKSGGTTRRAAKMVVLDDNHPEIMDFIKWKTKEEQKVRDLGKMGYDLGFDGEAYATVSGQNSNNSVRVSDDTMDKVLNLDKELDSTLKLTGRVDHSIDKKIKIKEFWDQLNESEHACADPAMQFDGRYNVWHTCPLGEDGVNGAKYNRVNSTNPCSEYAFLDDTACNLASINIYKFYDPATGKFNVKGLLHLVGLIQLVLESSIHWGQFPTEDVARKSYMFRTTGLGPANTASLIMACGYSYDSEEARTLVSSICGLMTGYSYYVSSLMAQEVGSFPKFELNKEPMLRVIRNHCRVAGAYKDKDYEELGYKPLEINHRLLSTIGFSYIGEALKKVWDDALEGGEASGYRNAQVTVVAPTGTISFAMDCGATSIEPFYSHIVYKKLVGGGNMTIVNPVLEEGLKKLGYKENEIKAIIEYVLRKDDKGFIVDGKIEGAPFLKKEHYAVFDTAGKCGTGDRVISPEGHTLMVSTITPMISGSVSKTVNMPAEATVEDIKNLNILAYKTGSKAIAIYRDGSKASQPLTSIKETASEHNFGNMTYTELVEYAKSAEKVTPERHRVLGIRKGTTHPAKIGDIELYITVNYYPDGKISEIFVSTDKEGTVVKGLLASLSKAISNMLQSNIPAENISKMLRGQQYEPSGFVQRHPYIKSAASISDLVSKVIDIELGDYSRCQVKPELDEIAASKEVVKTPVIKEIPKEEGERIYGEVCPNCSSTRLVRNGTCKVCLDCGSTTGCS